MVTEWLDRLIAEIVKTLVRAIKATGYLLWYGSIGMIAGVRKLSAFSQDRSLRQTPSGGGGDQEMGVSCPACGVLNESDQGRCFACGSAM